MTSTGSSAPWAAAGLVALALVFYAFPLALDAPLTDPDEGLHAAVAQEMTERGDWVVPRFLGEPFLDKPILYFWAEALSLRLLGMSETAVRLPGLLFGLLGALTTAWLAGALAGRRAAVLSGAIYATLLLPLAINQAAVHDVALVPWTNLALLGLWRAARRPAVGGAIRQAALAGVFVGLAMLTKGLVGVALIGLPFALLLVLERRLNARMVAAGVTTLAVGVLLAAPWYVAMEAAQPGYLHYFFVERHLLGFATSTQIHGARAWWYYLPIVLGGGVPWILYLPFATRRSLGARWGEGARLAWVWLVTDVLILSVARSKLVTYLLPAFPAVAILAALVWMAWIEADDRRAPAPWRTFVVFVHGLLGVALIPVARILAERRFGVDPSAFVLAGGSAILVPAILGPSAWRSGAPRRAFVWLVAVMGVMFVTVIGGLFPPIARALSARDLALYLNAQETLPPAVWVVDERVGSVVFYLEPSRRRELTPGRIENVGYGLVLGRLASAPADVVVAAGEQEARRLDRSAGEASVPHDRAGRFRVYRVGTLREHLLGRRGR